MNQLPPDRSDQTVIFLHLGKTGGMTLNTIMDWNYPRKAVYTISRYARIAEFTALPEEERRKIRCLKGQIFFGIHQWLPRESTYVTLLRHPVRRVISQYYYNQVRRQREGIVIKEPPIEWFLELDEPFRHQIGLIAGGNNIYEIVENPLRPDALEIAKHNLQTRFSVVGITEQFSESVLLMKMAFGWRTPFYANKNVAPQPEQKRAVSPEVVRVIEKKCEAELELYEFARKLLAERLREQEPAFYDALRRLERNNRLYNQFWRAVRPLRETRLWRFVRSSLPR